MALFDSLSGPQKLGVVLLLGVVGYMVGSWGAGVARPAPTELRIEPVVGSGGAGRAGGRAGGRAAKVLLVQVDGAVRRPGLYELASGSRVGDALTAAGGVLETADLSGLNLARILSDGGRVSVPFVGAGAGGSGVVGAGGGGSRPGGGGTEEFGGRVNVNRASAAELEALPGIGPRHAAAIVEWREVNGRFERLSDLDAVPGLGPGILGKLEGLVTF